MYEKEVLQKAKLPIWQIIAFYMKNTNEKKEYNITELLKGLSDIIKVKYSTMNTSKHESLLKDGINKHSEEFRIEEPYIFGKNSNGWFLNSNGIEWVKNNTEVLCSMEKDIRPSQNIPIKKESNNQIYKKLKEELEKYILENYKYIYLLGQIYFGEVYYNLLKKYAKYCIETGCFAEHGDIAFVTAITKIVQKCSTSSFDVWGCLLKALNLKEIENKLTQTRIKKCFKETINFYKNQCDSKKLNLFIDTDKKNPQNIKYHCFISNDNCIKYFDFLNYCYLKYQNQLNVHNLKTEILKSDVSKNIINVIEFADNEQLEMLLSEQIECIKQFSTNKEYSFENSVKKDYIVAELYGYLKNPELYKKSLRKNINTAKINFKPEYKYINGYIQLVIPEQEEIRNKVSIEVISEDKILKKEERIYICNEPRTIVLENDIKCIFNNTNINIVSEDNELLTRLTIEGKNYRFFDKNGKEATNLYSIKGFYAYIIADKNVFITEEKDFVEKKEEASENCDIYIVSLKNRSKNVVIQGKTFYLSNDTPKDFYIESEGIKYLKSSNNIMYSTNISTIKVKNNGDIQGNAYITIVNKKNNKSITLSKNDFTSSINDENDDEFLIFEIPKIEKCYVFLESDNLYEIKYTNKNNTISKELLLIDDFEINFEKELYTDEKEIHFRTNKKIDFINAELIFENNNKYEYKYIVQSPEDPNENNPIQYEVSINGKTYSLYIQIPFLLFLTNDYRQYKTINKNETFFEYEFNGIKIKFPEEISFQMEPLLEITDLDSESYTTVNAEYNDIEYSITKEDIIDNDDIQQEKPYKKSLELCFNTKSNEYKKT